MNSGTTVVCPGCGLEWEHDESPRCPECNTRVARGRVPWGFHVEMLEALEDDDASDEDPSVRE